MNHQEQSIDATDGTSLHVEQWEPSGPVRFVIVLVHGGAEHVGRYERVARMFGEHGGFCFGLDHRGHGHSGGRRGHIDAFEDYTRDLRRVIETIAQQRPEAQRPAAIPWFIFGHSMGGLISLLYLIDHAKAVPLRGAVISSPLIALAMKVNPIKLALGKLVGLMLPTLRLPTGLPAEAICRDRDEVRRYTNDSRREHTITPGWFNAQQKAIARVLAGAKTIAVPCLWYVGTGDMICDHRATMALYQSIPDASERGHSLHCFDGYYHELHNEPEELRAPVMDMVQEWVLTHVSGSKLT